MNRSLALVWEVVTGGLIELWEHKLRSLLTLTLQREVCS